MTIAACYVSPEGIVLGADSTTTVNVPGNAHYFNHAQKLFEIGEDSTLGIVAWGLGGLVINSHRYLIARLGDSLKGNPVAAVPDVAVRWADLFYKEYNGSPPLHPMLLQARMLSAKTGHDPNASPSPLMRTADEEKALEEVRRNLIVWFSIGG